MHLQTIVAAHLRVVLRTVLVTLLAASFFFPVWLVAFAQSDTALDTAEIDAFVTDYLEVTGIPGASIAIVKDGEMLYVSGYGRTSTGGPVTNDTPMRIASLSKSFTALAIMQLVEAGQIDLDTPVTEYLNEFTLDDPRYTDITVRQLLNHTSGLSDMVFNEYKGETPDSLEASVARLQSTTLQSDPGTAWFYFNPNYHLAARLIEVVSGQSYETYMEHHVFEPAGMNDTTSVQTGRDGAPGLAHGHIFLYGRPVALPEVDLFFEGSGGVITTADDMAKWLVLQSTDGVAPNGTRLIGSDSLALMHEPGLINSYALGWDTAPAEGTEPRRVASDGGIGTYTARQVLYPETGYGIAVLLNGGTTLAGSGHSPDAVVEGIRAVIQERNPTVTGSTGSVKDIVLGASSLVALFCGAWGVSRSREWAAYHRDDRLWLVVFRLVPYTIPVVLFMLLPTLLMWVMQRSLDYSVLFYVWFALMAFFAAIALSGLAIIVARVAWLIQLRRIRRNQHTTGGESK